MTEGDAGLRAHRLSKSFGGIAVLRDVSLAIQPGKVHVLLGANGAGKSTLISCLSGALRPDAGTIFLDGKALDLREPKHGLDIGICVIHQQLSLVEPLSVSDNIFFGSEISKGSFVVRQRVQADICRQLLAKLGASIAPDVPVYRLGPAEQQLVEIAKALHRQARVLVLDEPTAALSDRESKRLLTLVRQLAAQGVAVMYVTHLLDEVFDIGDEVTVLRDGRVHLSSIVAGSTAGELIEAITGVEPERQGDPMDQSSEASAPLLEVRELESDRGGPVDLYVNEGEVVGVFGLLGSGRTELLESLAGVRPRRRGRVSLGDSDFDPKAPWEAIRAGVILVPSNRRKQALFMPLTALDNMLFASFWSLSQSGLRRERAERTKFSELAWWLRLQPRQPGTPAWKLSGGNQQKLAVGRWLTGSSPVRLALLDEPTQGVDIGARGELYRILRGLAAEQGVSVLFTSSSPDEVAALADRAVVLSDGLVVGELKGPSLTGARLISLANRLEVA